MYSNGGSLVINVRDRLRQKVWQREENDHEDPSWREKRFINCICPKCNASHPIYMMWTGRGVPRKYCGNCKPLVSGYDEAAVYEASVSNPINSKRRGRRYEGE
jgi:uncharacterized protein